MKRNTHQDAEARKVYDLFWESYLSGDENTFISLLDDEFKMIGTSEAEVCHNKAEAITFFRTTTNEISGKAELRNREISLVPLNGLILINEMANVYALIDTEWRFYSKIRLSTLLHDTETGWKVVHQHGSMPDTRVQEGETLAFEQIKTENLQLRDAVNRRTIELEHKNRELEIETSLERVRAVAMGMKHPADMLEVCHVISDQLQLLGVPDIRNVQTAIINAGKGAYMNYQYFATYQQGTVEVVEYNKHPKVLEMVQKMQQSPDAFFSTAFEGEELQVWRQYRKDDNQFPDPKLDDAKGVFFYFYSIGQGGLGISAYTQLNEEDIAIFHRFRNVFALAYSRFMDIEQAEAQAKEARIELALERVRARAMSMQNSDELAELVSTVFKELTQLDFSLTSCIIWINHPELGSEALWVASSEINKPAQPYYIKPFYHSFFKSISQAWKAKDPKWIYVLTGEEKDAFEEAFFNDIPDLPDALKAALAVPDKVVFSASFNNFGALEVLGTEPLNDEKFDVLHRFGRVFDLCYTRFNDLQKAEAQAREAQIEAALEKVRAKVMAMNTSQDLNSTSLVFGEQLRRLGIDWQFSYFWLIEENKDDNTFWITWPDHQTSTTIYSLAEADESFKECIIAWRNQERIHGTQVPVEHVQAWLDTFERITRDAGGVAVEIMKAGNFNDGVYYYDAMIRFGSFGILMNRATTDEEKQIQSRFATEFERAYTRFLDLQKAETQAREAHIEAALERVRSRTMAMARSDELSETAQLLFKQFKDLGETPIQIAIGTMHDEERLIEFRITDWAGSGSKVNQALQGSIDEPTLLHKLYVAWKEQKKSTVVDLTGKELVEWTKYRNSLLGIPVKKDPGETRRVISAAFFSKGMITMHTRESRPAESLQLLERFAGVFDLTYTRFLDLKKAEAQAREARIEVALERVRAQTMAMHKSEELAEASKVLFHELHSLGIETIRSGFGIFDAEKKTVKVWMTTLSNNLMEQKVIGIIPVTAHPAITANFNAWKQNQTFLSHEFVSEEVKQYYKALAPYVALPEQEILHEREWFNAFFFSEGAINVITEQRLSEEKCNIILRFARVFGLIYRRFLDLQKAEAQAREAKIEAALERLRAKAMAMHHSDELDEVLAVLCEQFDILGILPMSAHMTVLNIEHNKFTFRETGKFGNRSFGEQTVALDAMDTWKDMVESWKNAEPYSINSLHFPKETLPQVWEVFHESFASMPEGSRIIPDDYPDGIYHTAGKHPYGYIGMNQIRKATDEEEQIVIKFANEFGRAYTRFLDLQKAEAQARESKIEAALERIRAKAMAMHHSEDVNQAVAVVFEELDKLNLDMLRCGIGIIDKEKRSADTWITSKSDLKGTVQISGNESMDIHPLLQKSFDVWLRQEDLMYVLEGEDLLSYYRISGLGNVRLPDSQLILTESASKKQYYHLATFQAGGLFAFREMPFPEDAIKIMKRFAGVFHLTYKRFLDLQKAESQAREAKIEAALERVRSRSMGMQKSEELQEVVKIVYQQLTHLKIQLDHAGFVVDYTPGSDWHFWIADERDIPSKITHPYFESVWASQFNEAKEKGEDFFATHLNFEEKNKFYNELLSHVPGLPEASKDFYLSCPGLAASTVLLDNVGLYIENFSGIPYSDEENVILVRFGKVFQQTYTRFLDLKKAEAQAREAQIEAALERVRSRTMAMHKSEELLQVITVVAEQLQQLNFRFGNVSFAVRNQDHDYKFWFSGPGLRSPYHIHVPYINNPMFERVRYFQKEDLSLYTDILSIEESSQWHQHVFENSELRSLPAQTKDYILNSGYARTIAFMPTIMLIIGNYAAQPYTEEENMIFKRFAGVFEQSYTRFLDLQKAEAQAREAQIEASLERVRSKAMAMHKSEDLSGAVATVFGELDKLSLGMLRCGIGILDKEQPRGDIWITVKSEHGDTVQVSGDETFEVHPLLLNAYQAWRRQEDYYYVLQGNDLASYYKALTATQFQSQMSETFLSEEQNQQQYYFNAVFQDGSLFAFRESPFSDEAKAVMKRFAGVFNLTYKRFLDLQRAEAQAREAQIQLALERVRARTMAMHHSDELTEVVKLLYQEFDKLKISNESTDIEIGLINEETGIASIWAHLYLSDGTISTFNLPMTQFDEIGEEFKIWKATPVEQRNALFLTNEFSPEQLEKFAENASQIPELSEFINLLKEANISKWVTHNAYFSHGLLTLQGAEAYSSETQEIQKRFAKVFEQTYIRFLDLQKAEAQTREAVIEAALEKVRGKAMAMQTSNDLSATASTVFVELRKLGIHSIRSGVGLLTQESRKVILYAATSSEEGVSLSLVGWVMLQDHPVLSDIYDSWIRHEDYFPILKGELLQTYYAHILSSFSVPGSHYKQYVPDNALTDVNSDYAQHGYFLAFSEGFLYGWSEKPYMESEIKILNRFKLIIDLTFRRYLELQKSEANARDAVRQASLDRVRAQTASMRSTADLEKITPLMWNELTTLGVPFTRCGVFIMDDEAKIVHTYLSTAEGKDIAAIHLPYNGMSITEQVVAHWRNQSVYTEHWDKTAFHQWTKQLIDQGHISSTENYHAGTAPDDLHLHFVPFTQGMLYVGSTEPHPDESLNLIQSLADAFATAYARYEDFNRLEAAKIKTEQALADLESAKDQLVQQEKLASLGQLTAGIAHEIKNPLNFVNNFSEVSMELLDEMLEELEKGNSENVKSISDDIKANLDKIHEHGSRADSIVKSMLLHSRGGSGQKEPTDLNALIREYVNLTFHGMRAGKHAINVQIDLKLDETVGPVPVIVEDISRVIVNLCNNAFDAMRSKLADPSQSDYTPKLTVRTTRDAHHTLIEIADNGPGIPEDIKDKILQPFFTTKKGTQGTGLGLSITNDIVKAHGGELKVESVEGEGSVFVIQLPQAAEA